MARKKMQTPNKFTFDIIQLKSIIGSFKSKAELADFVTKSIEDLATGCKSNNVDSRILDIYNRNLNKMKVLQKTNEKYNSTTRKQLQGSAKLSTDGDTRKDSHEPAPAGNSVLPESGTSVEAADRTTVSDHFEARQSQKQNATEDAATREGAVNMTRTSNGATLESGTSSVAKFNDQEAAQTSTNAKSNICAGKPPVRVDCETESSRSESFPARDACKQRYGAHKHVLLTVEEGTKLREMFGKNLRAAIEILDEYIHSLPSKKNGKKNKKGAKWWREDYEDKNHYLCMTRWVRKTMNDLQTSELNRMAAENRFARSNVQPMSFAQMERERTARALRGESVDGKNYVHDEDLTPEEFMRKYG